MTMIQLVCKFCGQPFQVRKGREGQKYCSFGCRYNAQNKGGRAASIKRYDEKYIPKNREKSRAHVAVYQAIQGGRLKAEPCERCGRTPTDAHHDDYSQCLVVRWFCCRCHRQLHKELEIIEAFARAPMCLV